LAGVGGVFDLPADVAFVAFECRGCPAAFLADAAVEPNPCDLADGDARSFDAFAAVQPVEQRAAFGFRVGLCVANGGLPDLPSAGVAVGELVLAGDGLPLVRSMRW
jgi:hypothetical protein